MSVCMIAEFDSDPIILARLPFRSLQYDTVGLPKVRLLEWYILYPMSSSPLPLAPSCLLS